VIRRYSVLFFETFAQAKAELARIQAEQAAVDQLNVVIRAEGNMDDADLLAPGKTKVFAGTAWHLIHERRKQDGWYDEPR